jgi:drug/metabolite transporter (DMT)-like permease
VRAAALIGALALLWGSGFFWIALSLDGFTPVQLTFLRLFLGALVLVPIVLARRLPRPAGAVMWFHLAVSALVANAIPYTLFAVAEQSVPSSLAGIINATTPLWTLLLAAATRSDTRMTPGRAGGVALGFVGVLVLSEPWTGITGGTAGGILACIGAAASYGVAYIYQARFLTNRGLPPLTLTAAQLVLATGILALALPFSATAPSPTPLAVAAVVILGVIGTGLALIINFQLIATEGATAASVVTYLVPAVALLLGVLVLNEPASLALPLGGVLILAGVALTRTRRAVPPTP